jgi:hypothetical protein
MNQTVLALVFVAGLGSAVTADDTYLTSKGTLKQRLRVDCEVAGAARQAGAAAAVRCGVWLEIQPNGRWTRGTLVAAAAAKPNAAVALRAEVAEMGRLEPDKLKKIADSLQAIDINHLPSAILKPTNKRAKSADEDAAYKITVTSGYRKHTAYVTATALEHKQLTPDAKKRFEDKAMPILDVARSIFGATGMELPPLDRKKAPQNPSRNAAAPNRSRPIPRR